MIFSAWEKTFLQASFGVKEDRTTGALGDGYWLVVSNMVFIFHFIYGMSSFPLTNSYFSRWLLHHQPGYIIKSL